MSNPLSGLYTKNDSFHLNFFDKVFNLFCAVSDDFVTTKECLDVLQDLVVFMSNDFYIESKSLAEETDELENIKGCDNDDKTSFLSNLSPVVLIALDIIIQVLYYYLL